MCRLCCVALAIIGCSISSWSLAADRSSVKRIDETGKIAFTPTKTEQGKKQIEHLAEQLVAADLQAAWKVADQLKDYAQGNNRALRLEAIAVLRHLSQQNWPEGKSAAVHSMLFQIDEEERLRVEGGGFEKNERGEIIRLHSIAIMCQLIVSCGVPRDWTLFRKSLLTTFGNPRI